MSLSQSKKAVTPVPAPQTRVLARSGPKQARKAVDLAANYSLPIILLGLVVVFTFLEPASFGTVANLKTILASNSVIAILALGALLPLVVGQFDLSVGANLGLSAILVTGLPSRYDVDAVTAILVAVGASTLVGVVNGVLVAHGKIDAFVTTLGVSVLVTGGVVWFSNGQTFASNIPTGLTRLGQGSWLGIPSSVYFLVAIVAVAFYVLNATPLGRYLYAVGGSKEASRLSGLNVPFLTILAFVGAGALAGVAGVLQSAQLGAGNPAVGPPYLLPAFAGVFLGATAFKRGAFNVLGTVTAVFTIAVGVNGLIAVGAPYFVEPIFTGFALITAALFSRIFNQRAARVAT